MTKSGFVYDDSIPQLEKGSHATGLAVELVRRLRLVEKFRAVGCERCASNIQPRSVLSDGTRFEIEFHLLAKRSLKFRARMTESSGKRRVGDGRVPAGPKILIGREEKLSGR